MSDSRTLSASPAWVAVWIASCRTVSVMTSNGKGRSLADTNLTNGPCSPEGSTAKRRVLVTLGVSPSARKTASSLVSWERTERSSASNTGPSASGSYGRRSLNSSGSARRCGGQERALDVGLRAKQGAWQVPSRPR